MSYCIKLNYSLFGILHMYFFNLKLCLYFYLIQLYVIFQGIYQMCLIFVKSHVLIS